MANGNGNGNGDVFRVTKGTLVVLIAIGGPIGALAVGGYQFREQVRMNTEQAVTIDRLDREAWEREKEIKTLREDVDDLMRINRLRVRRP
jgi:hypothetical protein